MDKNIILKINDKKIPLNLFLKRVFINIIEGTVKPLKKLPENIEKIEIKIEKNKADINKKGE